MTADALAPIAITYQTPTGRHLTACPCGRAVTAKVSKPLSDRRGQYRKVDTAACRGCGLSRHYVVRPRVMTPAEMAAISERRRAAREAQAAAQAAPDEPETR